jgi:hypothetical protein
VNAPAPTLIASDGHAPSKIGNQRIVILKATVP